MWLAQWKFSEKYNEPRSEASELWNTRIRLCIQLPDQPMNRILPLKVFEIKRLKVVNSIVLKTYSVIEIIILIWKHSVNQWRINLIQWNVQNLSTVKWRLLGIWLLILFVISYWFYAIYHNQNQELFKRKKNLYLLS